MKKMNTEEAHLARDYILTAFDDMVAKNDTRELGKMLAMANEHWQRDWINKNTNLKVSRREDVEDCDNNQSGYDLLSLKPLRIQSKFRSTTLHMENTRRVSEKNRGMASSSGHVTYSCDECDIFCITRPCGEYENVDKWEMLAIPASELADPKRPGFLRGTIPKAIENQYRGRAKEILENAENAACI